MTYFETLIIPRSLELKLICKHNTYWLWLDIALLVATNYPILDYTFIMLNRVIHYVHCEQKYIKSNCFQRTIKGRSLSWGNFMIKRQKPCFPFSVILSLASLVNVTLSLPDSFFPFSFFFLFLSVFFNCVYSILVNQILLLLNYFVVGRYLVIQIICFHFSPFVSSWSKVELKKKLWAFYSK